MKYFMIFVLTFFINGHSFAEENTNTFASQDDIMEMCKSLSTLSGTIMRNRQAGVPMSAALDSVIDGKLKPFTIEIIKLAYAQPKYATEEYQENSVNEFSNQYMLQCLNVFKSN